MQTMAPAKTLDYLPQKNTLESSFIRYESTRPKGAYNQFSNDEIPIISLAGINDVGGRRVEICDQIAKACENWGIFQVVDHGVDQKLIYEMTSFSKGFFDLPLEEKLRFDMSGGKKGGFVVGKEMNDWRERMLYFSYPIRERDYSRWPDKPEGWKEVTEEYSEKLMSLTCKLFEVLSEAMGLEKEALTKASVDMVQKIVVNYYPKCPQPDLTLGLKRHTDPGTITLVFQEQVGGLQVTRDEGETWITVPPVEGAFVVNIGDHGHYLSNGRFKRADHRAVVNSSYSRLSVATFQYPATDAIVYPLKVREGDKYVMEEHLTFAEIYRRNMSNYLEQK